MSVSSKKVDTLDTERLLIELCTARSLPTVAKRLGVTLVQLAAFSSTSTAQRTFASMRRLAAEQAAIAVERRRMRAAADLARLAADKSLGDVARKACVDLLHFQPAAEALMDANVGVDGAETQGTHDEAIRALLETFARVEMELPQAKTAAKKEDA